MEMVATLSETASTPITRNWHNVWPAAYFSYTDHIIKQTTEIQLQLKMATRVIWVYFKATPSTWLPTHSNNVKPASSKGNASSNNMSHPWLFWLSNSLGMTNQEPNSTHGTSSGLNICFSGDTRHQQQLCEMNNNKWPTVSLNHVNPWWWRYKKSSSHTIKITFLHCLSTKKGFIAYN